MSNNPGDDVLDFVMLHLALHDRSEAGTDNPADHEHLAESYHQAMEHVADLAESDRALCLTLLADLAGHFAATLARQAGHHAVREVAEDWDGRGWTRRVHRAGAISSTAVTAAVTPAQEPPALTGARWPAGDAPPF